LLNGRRLELHATSGGLVGCGDNGNDVKISLNECLEASNREIRGAKKYNAHHVNGMEKNVFWFLETFFDYICSSKKTDYVLVRQHLF
jgi:hypothetical protein